MNTIQPLLEVKNLKVYFPIEKGIVIRKRIGWLKAVDDVSFLVQKGEAVGLVGESGCGKSTTALAIAQLQRITNGQILFEGRNLSALPPSELYAERRNFQMVFQDPYSSLDPRMTAFDSIAEPLRIQVRRGSLNLSEADIRKKVLDLMDKAGLSRTFAHRYPHEFSGGQRQRIGIARALALSPKLVIADEPVSALDVSIQSQILNLMKDLQAELGLTYLFIAHNLAVVEYFCGRIVVMYLGTIAEIAPSEMLYHEPLHPYTKALLSAVPIPDPPRERQRSRILLKGDVPSPSEERAGCPFFERCPSAMDICNAQRPLLREAGPGHIVACHLYAREGDSHANKN
ncbi:MAG: ABC transporter ATP-binding protein [Rectinema subterraneum]|uniref:ABC transporter ATP-binding protein n=1 Tax=Rectinema subterraneum TaxID=2653714 RepID=UPI003C7E7CE8